MYEFPYIAHISDVLPSIAGKREFVVVERGPFTFINYNINYNGTFPPVQTTQDAILRECRGIVFDTETGKIVSRRLHKFFNLNEKPECNTSTIDLNLNHIILNKLDGSMVTFLPIKTAQGIEMKPATKMGFTDTAAQLDPFLKDFPNYVKFARNMHIAGLTAIFEWCSDENRIVIGYSKPSLTLIAIRDTTTGRYLPMTYLNEMGDIYKIPVIESVAVESLDVSLLQASIQQRTGVEGVVIRFETGHMVKIKTNWYTLLHKAKSFMERDDSIVKLILDGEVDDIRSMFAFDTNLISRIDRIECQVQQMYSELVNVTEKFFKDNIDLDRKHYAILAQQTLAPHYLGLVMGMYSGKQPDYKGVVLKKFL